MPDFQIVPVTDQAGRRAFVDYAFSHYADDPQWVPPLKGEAVGMITPGKNAWLTHADQQLFLAKRGGKVVGRISAHIDRLALEQPPEQGFGPGTGFWGYFDADDEAVGRALIAAAEHWLRDRGMTRALGPVSASIWEEPGLLIQGHDHPPTVMMGHQDPRYQSWIEAIGYEKAKDVVTYDLDVTHGFPPLVNRIVEMGEKNPRIRIRKVDKSRFDREAAIILSILNDAWSDNWGFVPLTDPEVKEVGKKLKPIVFEDLIYIAEVEGEPVAFMITLPDLNEPLKPLNGSLLPFGWAKLLLWLRHPKARTMRVPLMGVIKRLQASRLASQLAFMMIEYSRRAAVSRYGAQRGEIGWILEDNQGMVAIADTIESKVNKLYRIYEKTL
ncbi:N-acetyltransferase [Sphingomonas sp. MAH-20]|uniref:N-acetyltransferase n=1 Tax=Sphingomonas horti TaxID=2682842 RepID=A0A6I4J519_9SPHN|nr:MULTISPECIES: GNAT family N-acetyltransferase [Sphingomonas]MBA2919271.1 GNAT family N-acetyltransferase [Sphingomonas sp. CGMCC 1.13658]MVO79304.1 N-acetyltransferase [Sphingomonas horti]